MTHANVLCIVTESHLELIQLVIKHRRIEADLRSAKGQEGLALARQEKPDVILISLHVPDANAWDILREIKTDDRLKDVPVVLIGKPRYFYGYGEVESYGPETRPEPDVWLDEPFSVQDFVDALCKLLK